MGKVGVGDWSGVSGLAPRRPLPAPSLPLFLGERPHVVDDRPDFLVLQLIMLHGLDATLTQMGWFFTKAALLTFGGAYAVLPYVYQGAVEQYHWLTARR